ncbi:MAG: TetR/AcrR family transcriptional regulator [Alphaproteobacteria bacterium]|jgi:AcrR family transcriptional regulator|nr:TetR/AcrR family transcriptional regulator [Alphaproteobacteria bacterium]
MAGKVEERRRALRAALIDHAERRIHSDGLSNLRARDLARDAGCALGAIYNVFGDLNDLVLAVNARTFERLGADVAAALADAPQDPTEQLVVMAQAYYRFAAANHNAWRALFDIDRPFGESAPDWYLAEMAQLFAYIEAPLRILMPEMADTDRALMTRALFSSVHGVVLLALDEASAGVPAADVDRMIALLLTRLSGKQTVS